MKLMSFRRLALPLAAASLLAWPMSARPQESLHLLKSFGSPSLGTHPHSGLLLGQDGLLYGTTELGGTNNCGTVFRLRTDGQDFTLVHQFSTNNDGVNPAANLIQGTDGTLYGTTLHGGTNRCGTLFALSPNGSSYSILHHFNKTNSDGQYPSGRLAMDSAGVLYGLTHLGTNINAGTAYQTPAPGMIFRINGDGSGFASLHSFPSNAAEGINPTGLILSGDGYLYGTTRTGGIIQFDTTGRLFKLRTDGSDFTVWSNIPSSGPRAQLNTLIQGANGLLYACVCGSVSSYATNAEAIFSIATNGAGYTRLHAFVTNGIDGQIPDCRLLSGLDGSLYGLTSAGGTNNAGTVFKLNPDGTGYGILHHFQTNGTDGRGPEDMLIQAADGTLYGTTLRGGPTDEGTLFSLQPDGTGYRQLYVFNRFAAEAQTPSGTLVSDGGSFLYGTTLLGGSNGFGTAFRIDTNGSRYSVQHHFGGAKDGRYPTPELLHGLEGAWYGTTSAGGSNGYGSIYQLSADGTQYRQLYAFKGTNDGDFPLGGLIQDTSGLLFGAAASAGTNKAGTLFQLDPATSQLTLLHTFLTNNVDGNTPSGALTRGADGALFGLTEAGGTNLAGTLFRLDPADSSYRILHHFKTNGADGILPQASLVNGLNGALYGITQQGGNFGAGALFTILPDGSGYTILHHLPTTLTNPLTLLKNAAALTLASGNTLFALFTEAGGSNTFGGALVQAGTDGTRFSQHCQFPDLTNGPASLAGRLEQAGPAWFGTSQRGGEFGTGTIYQLRMQPPRILGGPQSQTGLLPNTVTFQVSLDGSPADCQWCFNGLPISNAIQPSLTLPLQARTNAGIYSVIVSNAAGVATSTNAVLTIFVPTHLSAPVLLPDGTLHYALAYLDNQPLAEADLPRFHIETSTNLVDWSNANITFTVTDGHLSWQEPTHQQHPSRFYRVVEAP
jgi:uncharacterized repeat protein (TIGR03803 family)